jgi:galactose mutarotase-like enzyme
MDVRCTYSFIGDTTLAVEVEAAADAATVVNFAQHSYFNLNGSGDMRPIASAPNSVSITSNLPIAISRPMPV